MGWGEGEVGGRGAWKEAACLFESPFQLGLAMKELIEEDPPPTPPHATPHTPAFPLLAGTHCVFSASLRAGDVRVFVLYYFFFGGKMQRWTSWAPRP